MVKANLILTGQELAELRLLVQMQTGKLNEAQVKITLNMLGYTMEHCTVAEQIVCIAEKLYRNLG